nr:hypothetical protein [Tanacetum cinerariifolium]
MGHGSAHGLGHGLSLVFDDDDDSPVEEMSPVKAKKPSKCASRAKKNDGNEKEEEMLRLQALGTMKEREILAQVLGGKQRGHLPGIGRKVAGDPVAQQEATQKQDEKFQLMVEFLSQTQGMSQLATMFPGYTTEVGSTSGTASASEDPSPSENVDPSFSESFDGDDEDDGDIRDL